MLPLVLISARSARKDMFGLACCLHHLGDHSKHYINYRDVDIIDKPFIKSLNPLVKHGLLALCFTPNLLNFVFGSSRIAYSRSNLITPVLMGYLVWCCGFGHGARPLLYCFDRP